MVAFLESRGPHVASAHYTAADSSTPADILHHLSTNCDVQVRIAVADNGNTQLHTHMQLALDEHPDLRYALAENHNIDATVLQVLIDDTNPYVAARAKRTLARLVEGTNRADPIAVLFGITSGRLKPKRMISGIA
jgi:hypothetical protein